MLYTVLPHNSTLNYMRYSNEVVTIGFKKANYERSYNVIASLAFKLYYSKTAKECLKAYNNIKKEGRFINVKPIKN